MSFFLCFLEISPLVELPRLNLLIPVSPPNFGSDLPGFPFHWPWDFRLIHDGYLPHFSIPFPSVQFSKFGFGSCGGVNGSWFDSPECDFPLSTSSFNIQRVISAHDGRVRRVKVLDNLFLFDIQIGCDYRCIAREPIWRVRNCPYCRDPSSIFHVSGPL
jgi:hypothetical protein